MKRRCAMVTAHQTEQTERDPDVSLLDPPVVPQTKRQVSELSRQSHGNPPGKDSVAAAKVIFSNPLIL